MLVNRAFDFGLAMTLEAGGAGLAVVKRRRENAALAEQLASLGPIDVEIMARALCEARPAGCPRLSNAPAHVYALLFGDSAARLRVLVEPAERGAEHGCASISPARPVIEFAEPQVLYDAFELELRHAIALFEDGSGPCACCSRAQPRASTPLPGVCQAGDGLQLKGTLVTRDAARVVIAAVQPSALVQCPADAFTEEAPAPTPAP